MPPEPPSSPEDEPTRVSPTSDDAPQDVVTDAPPWPDPVGAADGPRAAAGDGPRAAEDDLPPVTDDATPGAADQPPTAGEPSAKRRARSAADRTAEGAKVAADRVSQAASATAQALRETDVNEIARHTTRLIENTRPFFLAAFAIVFTFLASVENHAAVGVVFAVAAVLCVLGAAFSPAVDQLLKRADRDRR